MDILVGFTCLLLSILFAVPAEGHGLGPMGAEPLAWQSEQISGVVGGGLPTETHPHVVQVGDRTCVAGWWLNFNVRDEFAFDIDETVELQIEFYTSPDAGEVVLAYDRNDGATLFNIFIDSELTKTIDLKTQGESRWQKKAVLLERARFANLGFAGTDFSLMEWGKEFTVCGITLRRSYTTPLRANLGVVNINVFDAAGRPTPARMGIYDRSGRLPLPSDEAVQLRTYNGPSRIIALRADATPWSAKNHSVFYVGGSYHATLPQGSYELVVSKGPEYRIAHQNFVVKGGQARSIGVSLERWTNMADKGWYSGDDHIHYARESALDDHNLLLFTEAEDLNLGNTLQMGNSGNTYFRQRDWRYIANDDKTTFVLVPGQEDPRTSRLGHTLHLNIKEPVRNPARYLLYNETFAKTRAQGGITGYAHLAWEGTTGGENARAGLALDVADGLVDFVEVLQVGMANAQTWFDFLNLGYKIAPAAGTDWPYADVPGAVRIYVRLDNGFTPQGWFDGLRRGHNFVTNGPMLALTLNGQPMGSDLHVKAGGALAIEASASINPDVDLLDRLELIEQGEVVKTVISSGGGAENLSLRYRLSAKQGSWFVSRAYGRRHKKQPWEGTDVVALSAPIYVSVDGDSHWKPSAVTGIVAELEKDLQHILDAAKSNVDETWDTDVPDETYWPTQKAILKERIDKAVLLYESLARKATTGK